MGKKKPSQFVAATHSHPQTIGNILKQLLDNGEIVKVKRGVYKLPEP